MCYLWSCIHRGLKAADLFSVVGWLLAQCGSPETACRVQCRNLFVQLAPLLPSVLTSTHHAYKLIICGFVCVRACVRACVCVCVCLCVSQKCHLQEHGLERQWSLNRASFSSPGHPFRQLCGLLDLRFFVMCTIQV